jgi:hypothetical protein
VTAPRCPWTDREGNRYARRAGHDAGRIPRVVVADRAVRVFRTPVRPTAMLTPPEPCYVDGPGSTGTTRKGAAT